MAHKFARKNAIPDLPPGYECDKNRKCAFTIDFDSQTGGYYGLALAVLIEAVKDGCNPEWLKEIVDYYGIRVDPGIFDRVPARKLKLLPSERKFVAINYDGSKEKLSLSWKDGLPKLPR